MILYFKEYKAVFFSFFLFVFVLYGNSLKNKYALDDDYVTVTNFPEKGKAYIPNNVPVSKGFKGIPKILKSRYAHDTEGSFDYRPVTSISFAIEYAIFGQSPFVSHLISLLLYAITLCVMFCVLLKLFETYSNKLLIASLVCFIFLILPIHTEVVNNIKSRDELLAFLFPLIAFWYCLKAYDKMSMKYILLIMLFFILGFYSKKSALIFLGIIPLSLILFRKVNFKKVYIVLAMAVAFGLLNSLLRKQVISENSVREFYHFENPMFTEHFTFFGKLIAGLKTMGFYFKFSLLPYPFRSYYGTGVIDISSSPDIYLAIGLLFLIGSALVYYKTKNKLFIYGCLLFLGGVFPFANFLSPVAGVVGERLAYNASFGFAVIAASLLLPLFKDKEVPTYQSLFKKPMIYVLPVVLACTILIWNRNSDWANKITVFEKDIEHLGLSAKANSMLGNEYFEQLRSGKSKYTPQVLIDKALNNYQVAIKNDSSFYSAYNNAAVLYFSYLQNLPEAERYIKLGLKTRPVYPQTYENLGNLYRHQGRTEEALKAYLKSIEQNPKQYNAYISAIKLCYVNKQYTKAIAICRLAQSHFPSDYSLIGQEADCLFMLNRKKEALEKYEEAYNLSPNKELAAYLSAQYLELGDTAKSNQYKTP